MLPFYRWGNQSSKGFDGFLRVVHVASVRLVTETAALFALCQSRCGGWSLLLTWLDLDSPRKHTSRCLWACLQKCLPSRKDNSKWAAPSPWWIGVPGWIQSSSRLSKSLCFLTGCPSCMFLPAWLSAEMDLASNSETEQTLSSWSRFWQVCYYSD